MSRNANSRFAVLPTANIQRSKFRRPSDLKTAFNSGLLVPFYLEKVVLPGDTHSMRTTVSIRMSTPIHPVMDDAYLDMYYFFVPYRLVWDDFENFISNNSGDYWFASPTNIQEPHLFSYTSGDFFPTPQFGLGTVYDYFGLPLYSMTGLPTSTGITSSSVSALPFRAYALIWNDWFRSEITDIPCVIRKDSTDRTFDFSGSYVETAHRGGELCPVSKFHDYFTSALPEPQRGPDVLMPMAGQAPVIAGDLHAVSGEPLQLVSKTSGNVPVLINDLNNLAMAKTTGYLKVTGTADTSTLEQVDVVPGNLVADLSLATSATINQLREALALQSFFEKNARFGTRYTEILRGHFGVTSPDSRLQRPEYIGGKRVRINMQQVLQNSSTNETSPQGNTAAFSWTIDTHDSFTYSAVEHGMIIGLCCVRTKQTYQYGIEKSWSTRDAIDYYWPSFAHIGEQPILNKEIYAQGTAEDNEVFGYQEYAADYRYKPSRVTGVMRSNAPQSLDVWHYAEKLDSLPTLSSEWMHQSPDVIDRTLAVDSSLQPQFIASFDFDMTSVRPMPMYSIPGLGYHF